MRGQEKHTKDAEILFETRNFGTISLIHSINIWEIAVLHGAGLYIVELNGIKVVRK